MKHLIWLILSFTLITSSVNQPQPPNGQPNPGTTVKQCSEEYLDIRYLPTGQMEKHLMVRCSTLVWTEHTGWYSWSHDDTVELVHGPYWTSHYEYSTELW